MRGANAVFPSVFRSPERKFDLRCFAAKARHCGLAQGPVCLHSMPWRDEFAQLLRAQFDLVKKRNSRYSSRSFAQKIGLSAGGLSELLSGKAGWKLSAPKAALILERLGLSEREKGRLLTLMGIAPGFTKRTLDDEQYQMLLDDVYFPILFSYDLVPELRQPETIAKRLSCDVQKVIQVTEGFLAKGFLRRLPDGVIERNPDYFETSDGVPSEVLRSFHRQAFQAAMDALEDVPAEKRDITSLYFSAPESRLPELRKEIRAFYERVVALAEANPKDRIYRLSVGLFPVGCDEGERP